MKKTTCLLILVSMATASLSAATLSDNQIPISFSHGDQWSCSSNRTVHLMRTDAPVVLGAKHFKLKYEVSERKRIFQIYSRNNAISSILIPENAGQNKYHRFIHFWNGQQQMNLEFVKNTNDFRYTIFSRLGESFVKNIKHEFSEGFAENGECFKL